MDSIELRTVLNLHGRLSHQVEIYGVKQTYLNL